MSIQAGTVLEFGIDTPLKSYGLLQTYEIENHVQRATAMAPDGKVVSIQEYQNEATLRMTYLPISAGSTDDPEIGVGFTFDSRTWQIDHYTSRYTVDGFREVDLEASYYEGIH